MICVSFVYDLITSELCLWWRHQMETIFRVTGPLCGEFNGDRWNPLQRPVTLSFGVIIDLYLNRLSKQSRRRWFETPFYSLWCYCNAWIKCLMIENIPLSRVLQMPAWHKENYTPLTLCAGILLGTSGFPSQGISGVELWCFIPIFMKKMLHKQ